MTKKGNTITTTTAKADWTEAKEKIMLNAFSATTTKHGGDGKSLKGAGWEEVKTAYNKATSDNLVNAQLQSKLGDLKQKYSILSGLINHSGAEFDESTGVITMDDDHWDEAISKNAKAKWHRTHKFPHWSLCDTLFKASTATGEFAEQMNARKPCAVEGANANDGGEDPNNGISGDDDDDINTGTNTKPPPKGPPVKRSRVDPNTMALITKLKEISEKNVDEDPSEVSFKKAIEDFKRIKDLESTPLITTGQSVQIKELLASNHIVFNSLDDDEEKLVWIGQKLNWED